MSDALPQLPGGNTFTNNGESVFEFDGSDFGVQPEWDKEDLQGQMLIIRGLSEDVFQSSNFPPARSILYNIESDGPNVEPWGMMFSDTSPIIEQVRKQVKRGRIPFIATIRRRDSEAHRGQTYWTLEKYVRNVTPTLPNDPALSTTTESGRKSK